MDAPRRGRAAADDRLCQRRGPGAGARGGARAGARGARGPRVFALATGAAARSRERAALTGRRRRRSFVRSCGDAPAAGGRTRGGCARRRGHRSAAASSSVSGSSSRSSPGSHSASRRRCSTRVPTSKACCETSGRGSSGSRRHARFRQVLVTCQIALALVLLTGAGLLLRSFQRLSGSISVCGRPAC